MGAGMAKATDSKADRESLWWADWFAADYSWEGLSKHIIPTGGLHGEKTLQDYWRRDPATGVSHDDAAMRDTGELIDFDGRTWHLAHLPPRGRVGSATSSKANPDHPDFARLAALVATRVAAGVETPVTFDPESEIDWRVAGPDGRARLDGAVLGPSPNHPDGSASPLHLSCHHAWIGQAEFKDSTLAPGADFSAAIFSGDAVFNRTTFSGAAAFWSATFLGDADFRGALFLGGADFRSTIFLGTMDCYDSNFSGPAVFYESTFLGRTVFSDTIFKSLVIFASNFTGNAIFVRVKFLNIASFSDSTFLGDARFIDASFSGNASLDAMFSGNADFRGATFTGHAYFVGATFTGNAYFASAVFLGPFSFPATIANPQRQFSGAFLGARFAALANFSRAGGEGNGGLLAAAFGGAQFEKGLLLTDGLDREADKIFPALLKGARDAAREDLAREKKARAANKEKFRCKERKEFHKDARKRRLVELESGCRTLKVAMGAARDEVREQRYYRFQLQARHKRSGVSWLEKVFGGLYGLTSNYGSGLFGPILSLGVLTFASGLGYWAWAAHYGVAGDQGFWEGQSFALSVVFKPFAVLAATTSDPAVKDWWPVALMNVSASVAWGLRGVTTMQSLASGVLIFLLALGVRRRFQVG